MAQTGPPAAYPDVLKGSKQVPSVRMAPDGVGFEIGSGTVQVGGATKKKNAAGDFLVRILESPVRALPGPFWGFLKV